MAQELFELHHLPQGILQSLQLESRINSRRCVVYCINSEERSRFDICLNRIVPLPTWNGIASQITQIPLEEIHYATDITFTPEGGEKSQTLLIVNIRQNNESS